MSLSLSLYMYSILFPTMTMIWFLTKNPCIANSNQMAIASDHQMYMM